MNCKVGGALLRVMEDRFEIDGPKAQLRMSKVSIDSGFGLHFDQNIIRIGPG
jgi:hypothetical protein